MTFTCTFIFIRFISIRPLGKYADRKFMHCLSSNFLSDIPETTVVKTVLETDPSVNV